MAAVPFAYGATLGNRLGHESAHNLPPHVFESLDVDARIDRIADRIRLYGDDALRFHHNLSNRAWKNRRYFGSKTICKPRDFSRTSNTAFTASATTSIWAWV